MTELSKSTEQQPASADSYLQAAASVKEERFSCLSSNAKGKVKRLTLKGAPVIASALMLISSAGCGNIELQGRHSATGLSPVGIEAQASSHESEPIISSITGEISGVTFGLDVNGLPVKYTTLDGTEVMFDKAKVEEAKKQTKELKEPEILTLIEVPSNKSEVAPYEETQEHSIETELPADTLSTTELEKRGIKIINTDKVEMFIRKGAFDKGELLEDYKTEGGNKLTIALVDSMAVSKNLLTDSRYDGIRDLLTDRTREIEEYRKSKIKELEKQLEDIRKELQQAKDTNQPEEKIKSLEVGIFVAKFDIHAYHDLFTDDLLETMLSNNREATGMYAKPKLFPFTNPPVIFIAAGRGKGVRDLGFTVSTYFDADGNFKLLENDIFFPNETRIPQYKNTHPSPQKYPLNPNVSPRDPKSYPFGAQDESLTTRHELAHDKLIGKRPFWNQNFSEYDTDMLAMDSITRAWNRWAGSGYKDNSGYYFVFHVKGEKGYILSKDPNQKPQDKQKPL